MPTRKSFDILSNHRKLMYGIHDFACVLFFFFFLLFRNDKPHTYELGDRIGDGMSVFVSHLAIGVQFGIPELVAQRYDVIVFLFYSISITRACFFFMI